MPWQGAEKTKEDSYAGLAARTCGPLAEGALQLGLFGFCFGVMAVYLVVIGDILAGAYVHPPVDGWGNAVQERVATSSCTRVGRCRNATCGRCRPVVQRPVPAMLTRSGVHS